MLFFSGKCFLSQPYNILKIACYSAKISIRSRVYMDKIMAFFRSKKIIVIVTLLVIVVLGVSFIIFNQSKTNRHLEEKSYSVYVGENPQYQLDFKETYYVYKQKNKEEICSDSKTEVIAVEVINGNVEDELDLIGSSIYDALSIIYESFVSYDDTDFPINITSNYKFDSSYLKTQIQKYLELDTDILIEVIYDEYLNSNEEIYYTITFDCDGGTTIDSVVVLDGDTITRPPDPEKAGYKFLEWQLNGETYDFSLPVEQELTLVAIWEENPESTTKKTNSSSSNNSSSGSNNNTSTSSKKLNLNDEIKIYEYTNSIWCGFALFSTNFEDIYPHVYIGSGNNGSYWPGEDATDKELAESDLQEKGNLLKYNSSKETTAINLLKKYSSSKLTGVANFEYSVENHRITYTYDYMSFGNINYITDAINVNKSIDNAFESAYKFSGPCGSPAASSKVLTEELCEKYNLECERR